MLLELIGVLMLLSGVGGEPVGAFAGVATVGAAAGEDPEVVIDALPVLGAPGVLSGRSRSPAAALWRRWISRARSVG